MLQVPIEHTGMSQRVPCYILDSSRPLWRGELEDCGLVIGTNALANLGFQIVDSQGCVLMAEVGIGSPQMVAKDSKEVSASKDRNGNPQETNSIVAQPTEDENRNLQEADEDVVQPAEVVEVMLKHDLHLSSQQTRVATVQLIGRHEHF